MKQKGIEQIQAEIREEFEISYKERLKTMQNMFQVRYQTLYDAILSVFDRMKRDEVLSAMLNDRNTVSHIDQRIKQIFSDVVTQQRQLIFKKLGTQITNLKFENQELSRQVKKMKESNGELQKNFYTQRLTFEQTKNNTNQELKRMKEENFNFRLQQKQKEKDLTNLRSKIDYLQEQNDELKTLINNIKEHNSVYSKENEEMNGYKTKMSNFSKEIQILNALIKENQEIFQKKYNKKKKEFKMKIDEYKNVILEMRNERTKTEEANKKNEDDHLYTYNEKKISSLIKEHEKKISQLKFMKEKEKNQLEKNHEYKIKEIQNSFEKLLKNKIVQVQANTTSYFQKMKEEGSNLQQYVKYYQQNYIPLQQFEEEVSKRDEILDIMKTKLQELDRNHQIAVKKQQNFINKIKEYELLLTSFKQKVSELQSSSQQLYNKLNFTQQTNNMLKINERKYKEESEEYQKLLKKFKEEINQTKKINIRYQQQKNERQTSVREKQRKIKDIQEQLQLLTKKIKNKNEIIQQLSKEKENLHALINQNKKQITNLQYKIKDKEMITNLNVNSSEIKINNLQYQLKQKNILYNDLQNKYQESTHLFQQEKKRNYQIDNQLKKATLENKFYKETFQLKKTENLSSIQEYKRIISDKTDKIFVIEKQGEKNLVKITLLEKSILNKDKYASSLKQKVSKLSKMVINKLQNLKKEGNQIKQLLFTHKSIIKNDESINISTLYKQIFNMHMINHKEKQILSKNLKYELKQQWLTQKQQLKNEHLNKMDDFNTKNEKQKNSLKNLIKQKEIKAEELSKQIMRLQLQLKKEKDQNRLHEKQTQFKIINIEKQKQLYENKLKHIIKEMKDEKQQIIQNYEEKKYGLELEVQNLNTVLKKLKVEIQSIQHKYQDQKIAITSQMRTIKDQEEQIQKIILQKDREIQKIKQESQNHFQSKRVLQNQNRSYVETINKKVQLIHEIQIKEHQISGELNLIRNKFQRINEQNLELKRKLTEKSSQLQEIQKNKSYLQNEIKDIKGALSRSHKNHELRALTELSHETIQLTQKVNEMRKVSTYLDGKAPLRS